MLYTDHYLLDYSVVLVCVFNFYVQFIMYPIYCYRSTVGLFKQTRWVMLFTSGVNLVLSIILGNRWGLFGILIATGISRIVTNFWYEPIKLFNIYFKKGVRGYFIKQAVSFICTGLMIIIMLAIASNLNSIPLMLRLVCKILLCAILPNAIYYVAFRKTDGFCYLRDTLLSKVKKGRN